MHEDLDSDPKHSCKPGMAAHICETEILTHSLPTALTNR